MGYRSIDTAQSYFNEEEMSGWVSTMLLMKHGHPLERAVDVFNFTLTDEDMNAIAGLDTKTSAFFSHYDPNMVEWFVKMVEERKKQHDSSKEKKNW